MTESETKAYWAEMSAIFEEQAAVAWPNLVAAWKEGPHLVESHGTARVRPVQTGAGVALIVNSVSYGQDRPGLLDEIIAKTALPVGLVATEDGRGYVNAWHEGPSDIDVWVYFERYENGSRVAHGYIDPVSRKIVQTG